MASREEEEISELQEDDRDQFSDQLASVGMLGRIAADHCIPLLTRYTRCKETPWSKYSLFTIPWRALKVFKDTLTLYPSTLDQMDRNILMIAFFGLYIWSPGTTA